MIAGHNAVRFLRFTAATWLAAAFSVALSGTAIAASEMPQMDFADPLTVTQIIWMAVIMIVLYFAMARWALPQIGGVIENRKRRIAEDLESALQTRTEANRIVEELEHAIRTAHGKGQAAIANAIADAKEKTRFEEEALKARLDAELARAKAEIDQTRRAALAVIRPVAEEVAHALVERLTGHSAERALINQALDTAQQ